MFPMRSISLELSLRRIAGVDVWASSFSMSVPACTCETSPSPDSILDFGRLLLQERNRLAQLSHAFSSCQYFDFNVIDFNFLSCVRALVAENFRLFWMNPEPTFSVLLFHSHNIF